MFENIENGIIKIKEKYGHIMSVNFLIIIYIQGQENSNKDLYKEFRDLTLNKKFRFKNREKVLTLLRIDKYTYITKEDYSGEELEMYIKGIAGDINTENEGIYLHFIVSKIQCIV